MNIIVHYPKNSSSIEKIKENLAEAQAKSVIERIQKMNLPEDETKRLITMICDKVKIAANT